MKRILALICSFALLIGLAGCASQDDNKLVVGATAKPHAEILEFVKPMLEKKGIEMEIKEFTDYPLLNPALNDGEIDANFFQHIPYLRSTTRRIIQILYGQSRFIMSPWVFIRKNTRRLRTCSNGATVGVPNDTTNGGRALMVLEIRYHQVEGRGRLTATDKDIAQNLKN